VTTTRTRLTRADRAVIRAAERTIRDAHTAWNAEHGHPRPRRRAAVVLAAHRTFLALCAWELAALALFAWVGWTLAGPALLDVAGRIGMALLR
jgi:hypothetical protein